MVFVTKAQYKGDYKLMLEFSDRRCGLVDLEPVLRADHRSLFRELQDIEKFRRFRVDMDTVVWDNGLDLAPEYLYGKLKDAKTNDDFFERMNS